MTVAAVLALWVAPRAQPPAGTVVVIAAGRVAGTLPETAIALRQSGGPWTSGGSIGGEVPAAPSERELRVLSMPAGAYDSVRLGDRIANVDLHVNLGLVSPLLLGIEDGGLVDGGAYAGNDDVNLGLGELAGRYVPMPAFELTDQSGRAFDLSSIAGTDVIIAAFHTTCHETCPLYTALFLQLAKRLPAGVTLVEVTTDPAVDTPSTLARYASEVGAKWTFATGTATQVAEFWKPFAVELSSGDAHTSTLALVDRHGFVRLVYRGAPKIGGDIPPELLSTLSPAGLHQLATGGDGWGAPDVLEALSTVAEGDHAQTSAGGGAAPAFRLPTTGGRSVGLSDFARTPVVINFWATYCPPCRAEMPMLEAAVGKAGMPLVLVNEGESSGAARAYLEQLGITQSLLDANLAVGRSYNVVALPTTIFVRADGTIDRRQVGELDQRVLAAELSSLSTQ